MEKQVDIPEDATSQAQLHEGAPNFVRSEVLFRGGRELRIAHNGREYRLRLTQNGKLILTA